MINAAGSFVQLRLPVAVVAGRLRGHVDANLPLVQLGGFRAELHACFTGRAAGQAGGAIVLPSRAHQRPAPL